VVLADEERSISTMARIPAGSRSSADDNPESV
jgi:hypothetical protein